MTINYGSTTLVNQFKGTVAWDDFLADSILSSMKRKDL
jgi:hypothetical protein